MRECVTHHNACDCREERASQLVMYADLLCQKLREIHKHPRYKAVWFLAHDEIGPYDGPKYVDELEKLEAKIKEILDESIKNSS